MSFISYDYFRLLTTNMEGDRKEGRRIRLAKILQDSSVDESIMDHYQERIEDIEMAQINTRISDERGMKTYNLCKIKEQLSKPLPLAGVA